MQLFNLHINLILGYCAIPNHFKAKAVRYRECTMADGKNYDGVTDKMDESSGKNRPFLDERLEIRSPNNIIIQNGVLRSDWRNTVPPNGDNDRLR